MSLVKTFLVRKVSIFSKNLSSARHARLCAGHFYTKRTPKENFPIKKQKASEENLGSLEFTWVGLFALYYSMMLATRPEPTVRPPSRTVVDIYSLHFP